MTVAELSARWRQDADLLAAHGAEQAAATCRRHAEQLEAALAEMADEPLDLAQASRESGYSLDRLRHMVAAGRIPNAGRKGAPRVRRADLPRKAKAVDAGFDVVAVAGRIAAGKRSPRRVGQNG